MARCICGIGRGKKHMKYCPASKVPLKYDVITIGAEDLHENSCDLVFVMQDAVKKVTGVKVFLNFDPVCDEEGSQAFPFVLDHFIYVANRKMTAKEMDEAFEKHNGCTRKEYMSEGY